MHQIGGISSPVQGGVYPSAYVSSCGSIRALGHNESASLGNFGDIADRGGRRRRLLLLLQPAVRLSIYRGAATGSVVTATSIYEDLLAHFSGHARSSPRQSGQRK